MDVANNIENDFLKSVDFQASFNYRAPRITPQGKDLSMYSIDLGLSKDIFKGKGTITANVRDLLNSRKRRAIWKQRITIQIPHFNGGQDNSQ